MSAMTKRRTKRINHNRKACADAAGGGGRCRKSYRARTFSVVIILRHNVALHRCSHRSRHSGSGWLSLRAPHGCDNRRLVPVTLLSARALFRARPRQVPGPILSAASVTHRSTRGRTLLRRRACQNKKTLPVFSLRTECTILLGSRDDQHK